jgi:hypothetical protein
MSFQILSFAAPLLWCVFRVTVFSPLPCRSLFVIRHFVMRFGDISFHYLRRGFVKENVANTQEQDEARDGL